MRTSFNGNKVHGNIKKKIFLRAADLIEHDYYEKMLAYTMVTQNKTVFEAEIDAICELVDFIRFNVFYTEEIMMKQPIQTPEHQNISEYQPLNGFVASITPFNFTAIAGNLATSPLFFGNSVIWKPSEKSMLSNYLFYQILLEAGLPPGVLYFCPMEPKLFCQTITNHSQLGAVLFTGSTSVLEEIFSSVGNNISNFNNFPKIIGESGGKNFHLIDPSYQIKESDFKKIISLWLF
jgi:1-pyrroline-5-carboxylate dehydrogenase